MLYKFSYILSSLYLHDNPNPYYAKVWTGLGIILYVIRVLNAQKTKNHNVFVYI